jgi:hypothetical protein
MQDSSHVIGMHGPWAYGPGQGHHKITGLDGVDGDPVVWGPGAIPREYIMDETT